MQQSTHWLIASVFFAALLPVTVWGYGFYEAPGDRNYSPTTGAESGYHASGSLRLQKGMNEDGYYVRVYSEGLRPEDIQVYIRHNRLVLQVEQDKQYGLRHPNARYTSQWQLHFSKQLRLPYDADWTRMTTSTKDGIMEIQLPRRNPQMPTAPRLYR